MVPLLSRYSLLDKATVMSPTSFQNSIIVKKHKDDVKHEYTESSKLPTDEQKAMWGSEASMLNRFRLGLDTINWTNVKTWLDIGCGTGRFFQLAERQNLQFQQLIGVDFTEALIVQAQERDFSNPINFEVCDLETMPADIQNVDLITLIGVLQLCGCSLKIALNKCVDRLAVGGQVFLTTKHLGWSAFKEKAFDPEPNHSWFLMNDVQQSIEDCGVEILNLGGFLPSEGKIVPLDETHTLFIHGIKRS